MPYALQKALSTDVAILQMFILRSLEILVTNCSGSQSQKSAKIGMKHSSDANPSDHSVAF